jgi:hypothetical protein
MFKTLTSLCLSLRKFSSVKKIISRAFLLKLRGLLERTLKFISPYVALPDAFNTSVEALISKSLSPSVQHLKQSCTLVCAVY